MSGFGGVIKLTGEKDYLNALKRIRQSLRETASRLSAIASSFKNSANDMDATRNAADRLKDVLKKQSDDAKSLRSSYEKLQKVFENNTKVLDNLQKAYENSRKELEKIEREAGKTSDEYKKQAEEVKKLEQNLEKETKKQQDNEIALSKVRTELNNSQSALSKTKDEIKKLEDSLKKSEDATKKANTEYGKLKTTIEKEEEALRKLKDQYKEVIIKEGDASDTAKKLAGQIKDLTGKLEDNKTKLKNVDDAAEKVSGGLKDVGEKAEKASSKFDVFKIALGDFVSNIALRAIDKLKEIATEAFNVGKNFEYSMSKVGAIAGAKGGDFDTLRTKAIEMGDSTIFSARESAEAMKYMAIAGWKTNEILAGIKPTLDLAASSGEDLARVSDILTDTMTAFGVSAEGAGRFADVLTAAALNANTDVGKMGETFKYVAPLANALGYSVEDTAIAIGAMADSNVKASQAGTDLRAIFTRLSTNIGASKNELGALDVLTERLGVAFYDATGKTRPLLDVITDAREAWKGLSQEEKINYAKTIAGQKAMAGWLTLMNTAPEKFNQVTDSIKNSSGTAQRVATDMTDNVEGDIKRLKSRVETAQINLAKAFEPETRGTLKHMDGISKVMNFVADNSAPFKSTLAGIATSIGSFFLAINFDTIIAGIAGAFSTLGAVVAANPITAIVAGVIGLATALVTLYNNSEGFKNFVDGFFGFIWDSVKELLEFPIDFFTSLIDDLVEGFDNLKNILGNAWEWVKETWGKAKDWFAEKWNGIVEGAEKIRDSISEAFSKAWDKIKEVWGKAKDWFAEKWNGIVEGTEKIRDSISEAFSKAWDKTKEVWGKAKDWFAEKWNGIVEETEKIRDSISEAFSKAWDKTKEIWGGVKDWFAEKFEKAWEAIKNVFSGWGKFFEDLWDKIKDKFSKLGEKIGDAIGSSIKSGINNVINLIEKTINKGIGLINGAIGLINMLPGVNIKELGELTLPRLAKGGVLDNGARAVIAGENGAEAIVPLEKNTKWISLVANQLQKQMIPQLSSNTGAYSEMRAQTEFNSLVNSFKQALSEMKVVMDEEAFGRFIDRTVSDSIYGVEA